MSFYTHSSTPYDPPKFNNAEMDHCMAESVKQNVQMMEEAGVKVIDFRVCQLSLGSFLPDGPDRILQS
jgi:hypothetical protein